MSLCGPLVWCNTLDYQWIVRIISLQLWKCFLRHIWMYCSIRQGPHYHHLVKQSTSLKKYCCVIISVNLRALGGNGKALKWPTYTLLRSGLLAHIFCVHGLQPSIVISTSKRYILPATTCGKKHMKLHSKLEALDVLDIFSVEKRESRMWKRRDEDGCWQTWLVALMTFTTPFMYAPCALSFPTAKSRASLTAGLSTSASVIPPTIGYVDLEMCGYVLTLAKARVTRRAAVVQIMVLASVEGNGEWSSLKVSGAVCFRSCLNRLTCTVVLTEEENSSVWTMSFCLINGRSEAVLASPS